MLSFPGSLLSFHSMGKFHSTPQSMHDSTYGSTGSNIHFTLAWRLCDFNNQAGPFVILRTVGIQCIVAVFVAQQVDSESLACMLVKKGAVEVA